MIPMEKNLNDLYDVLMNKWFDMAIGIKRDENDKPITDERFSPILIARSNPLDTGVTIPPWALINRVAFETWSKENGYGDGLSLTIKGHYVGHGMRHLLRKNK